MLIGTGDAGVPGDAMSSISNLRFNWLPLPSLYAQATSWTARQKSLGQQLDLLTTVGDIFASAASDQASGMINLAAQASLARTQAAAKAKVDAVLSAPSETSTSKPSDKSLTLPDGTIIKQDPMTYLPGGSKLNLAAGTLTLPNGTVIDTATGAKKVNVTV